MYVCTEKERWGVECELRASAELQQVLAQNNVKKKTRGTLTSALVTSVTRLKWDRSFKRLMQHIHFGIIYVI